MTGKLTFLSSPAENNRVSIVVEDAGGVESSFNIFKSTLPIGLEVSSTSASSLRWCYHSCCC